MSNNYIQLRNYSPFSMLYVFIDTIDHIYEKIMKDNGIVLKGIREYTRLESPYRLISCRIKNKDVPLFCNLTEKIRRNALILGYRDYDEMCTRLQECIIDSRR